MRNGNEKPPKNVVVLITNLLFIWINLFGMPSGGRSYVKKLLNGEPLTEEQQIRRERELYFKRMNPHSKPNKAFIEVDQNDVVRAKK